MAKLPSDVLNEVIDFLGFPGCQKLIAMSSSTSELASKHCYAIGRTQGGVLARLSIPQTFRGAVGNNIRTRLDGPSVIVTGHLHGGPDDYLTFSRAIALPPNIFYPTVAVEVTDDEVVIRGRLLPRVQINPPV